MVNAEATALEVAFTTAELERTDHAQRAGLGDTRDGGEISKRALDTLRFGCGALEHAFFLVHFQDFERERGTERIAGERMTVEERPLATAEETFEDAASREGRRHRQHAAREALGRTHQIGCNTRVFRSPHRPSATVAG